MFCINRFPFSCKLLQPTLCSCRSLVILYTITLSLGKIYNYCTILAILTMVSIVYASSLLCVHLTSGGHFCSGASSYTCSLPQKPQMAHACWVPQSISIKSMQLGVPVIYLNMHVRYLHKTQKADGGFCYAVICNGA